MQFSHEIAHLEPINLKFSRCANLGWGGTPPSPPPTNPRPLCERTSPSARRPRRHPVPLYQAPHRVATAPPRPRPGRGESGTPRLPRRAAAARAGADGRAVAASPRARRGHKGCLLARVIAGVRSAIFAAWRGSLGNNTLYLYVVASHSTSLAPYLASSLAHSSSTVQRLPPTLTPLTLVGGPPTTLATSSSTFAILSGACVV